MNKGCKQSSRASHSRDQLGRAVFAGGMAGGTNVQPGGGGDAVFTTVRSPKYNATMGDLGSIVLPYAPSGTKWMAGSSVEVGWAITYK